MNKERKRIHDRHAFPRWAIFPASTAGLLLLGVLLFAACKDSSAPQAWPARTIEMACFVSAGGGTDTVDRALAAALEPHLGVKVNVVNRTGGNGAIALNHVWSKPKDGYTWGGFSETIHPAPVMGAHHTTAKDWHWFMAAGAPDVVSVGKDAPWQTLDDLVAAAKAQPGAIKAAAGLSGGLHHAKLLALEKGAGIKFKMLPYKGSHPSQLAVLSKEADVVVTSVSEQAELIKSGDLRPLAMVEMAPYEFPGRGTIPAAGAKYPGVGDLPVRQWLGFALPKGVPDEVVSKVSAAFVKAMADPKIKELAAARQLTLYGYHGEQAEQIALEMERAWLWTLYDLGVAQKSPAEFGIKRP